MNPEILGSIATLVVLLSFFQKGERSIRRVNVIGALLFVVYGYLIKANSVMALNGILFILHIYKLTKMKNQ